MATWIERQWRTTKRVANKVKDRAVEIAEDYSTELGALGGAAACSLLLPGAGTIACGLAGLAGAVAGREAVPAGRRLVAAARREAQEWIEGGEASEAPPSSVGTDIVGVYQDVGTTIKGGEEHTAEPWTEHVLRWGAVLVLLGASTYAAFVLLKRQGVM